VRGVSVCVVQMGATEAERALCAALEGRSALSASSTLSVPSCPANAGTSPRGSGGRASVPGDTRPVTLSDVMAGTSDALIAALAAGDATKVHARIA
jgi:hypothetical protein